MSSHKEAPGIIGDPAADNTDVYAFVSPDDPDYVTLIANYVPFQLPSGGPNFAQFGEHVRYEIHIDNDGDGKHNITYRFMFKIKNFTPNTFLYNTGPIDSLDSPNWNRREFYNVIKIVDGKHTTVGSELACPPANIGPGSTPNYEDLADAAIHDLPGGGKVFAGPRAEGFYVDLGSIFDLGDLRPFQSLNAFNGMPNTDGVNATKALNIQTIAIKVPKTELAMDGYDASDPTDARSTIGVWATASRQRSRVYDDNGTVHNSGPWIQISRLGNPLFNEVLNPMNQKDGWNADHPSEDSKYASNVFRPELAKLLPVLYPGVFPHLAKYRKRRADLQAILLTGIPAGVIDGFQNFTTTTLSDMLRLNMAYAPSDNPSNLGLLGNDVAGFPNGRRVFDDVTTIELRAIAGATLPLVDPSYKPDDAAGAITQGLTSSNTDMTASNTVHYQDSFPYLGTPHSGYYTPSNSDNNNS